MKRRFAGAALLASLTFLASCSDAPAPANAAAAPPESPAIAAGRMVVGRWTLNLEKSQFAPGEAPKSQTRVYEDRGDGLIVGTFEGVGATGQPVFMQVAAKYDGTEYPFLVRGSATAGTISMIAVDAFTVESVQKEDGKPGATNTRKISPDGKTMTLVSKWVDPEGNARTETSVFDRL